MKKAYAQFEAMIESADPAAVKAWANACKEELDKHPRAVRLLGLAEFQKIVDKYAEEG